MSHAQLIGLDIQWDPVNTDTKGTCHSVRIIWVSVLSGLSEKTSGTHVLSVLRPKQIGRNMWEGSKFVRFLGMRIPCNDINRSSQLCTQLKQL